MDTPDKLLREAVAAEQRGDDGRARALYVEALRCDPTQLEALTNLGNLAFRTGYRGAARTAYAQAVSAHPENAVARVNLGNALLDAQEYTQAGVQYEHALRIEPGLPEAHQGFSYALARLGDDEGAAIHRDRGFKAKPMRVIPSTSPTPIDVLVLVSARGGNFSTDAILDRSVYRAQVIAADYIGDRQLPSHDVVLNTIGDADLCGDGLRAASRIASRSTARVVNAPAVVARTSRTETAALMRGIPGLVVPNILRVARYELLDGAAPFGDDSHRPLLLRTPGHNTGRNFEFVAGPEALATCAAGLPGDELFAIEYVDTRGTDGLFRKYRVMSIGGQLHPLHAAVSHAWKVHYFSADMADSQKHRDEDAQFLRDPESVVGTPALHAVAEIAHRLSLDYAGVDFGIDAGGNTVLFEANATMSIYPPDPDERFAYRKPVVERILNAVRSLL